MTDVIPDCLFVRDFKAEAAGGFTLAGMLFVRRREKDIRKKEKKLIGAAIQRLTDAAREQRPGMQLTRAAFNLDGSDAPPLGDKLDDDNWLSHHYAPPNNPYTTIGVRVDPRPNDGHIRLSDYDLKLIMGSH
jgi:hypothetical protein